MPGWELINELMIMERLGMSPAEALATATVNAAEVLGPGTFGEIVPGASADLLLLDANPLESTWNLRARRGVMARGYWFDGPTLDGMLQRIAEIYRDGDTMAAGEANLSRLVARMRALRAEGAIIAPYEVEAVNALVRRAGGTDTLP